MDKQKEEKKGKILLSSSIGKIRYLAATAVCIIVGILVFITFSHYVYAQLNNGLSSQLGHQYFLLVHQQNLNVCLSLIDLLSIDVNDSCHPDVYRVVPQMSNGYVDDEGGPGG